MCTQVVETDANVYYVYIRPISIYLKQIPVRDTCEKHFFYVQRLEVNKLQLFLHNFK